MYYKIYDWFHGEGYKGYRNTMDEAVKFAIDLQRRGIVISRISLCNNAGQVIARDVFHI